MSKKLTIALVLALVVCMMSTVAFAASSSITTDDTTGTTTTKPSTSSGDSYSNAAAAPATNAMPEAAPSIVVAAASAETTKEFEAISTVVDGGAPIIEHFAEETKTAIIASLPATVKAENLTMDEFIPVQKMADVTGPVKLTLKTTATYSATKPVVPMIGVMVNGEVVWNVVAYTVVDGQLVLDIPEELLAQMGEDAMITILSVNEAA